MGKIGGFLDFERREPDYRPVSSRLKDFAPVELRLTTAEIRAQAARCMDCGTPFCHGCGCPLANLTPEINDMVYKGRWKEALDLLLSTNNFPEFTARVCPALCEPACVLGLNDEPVTIRQIELAVIEEGFNRGYMKARPPRGRINRQAAVIGSGPAGLAVADTLNRAGVDVTVFDKARQAGGILRYGIPDFKLEKEIVDRRIRLMKEEGVVFEPGTTIGTDMSLDYLRGRFDAICLAMGAREPRDMNIPGRNLKGIHFAMDFLVRQNMKLAGEECPHAPELEAAGKDVVIIGGGDTGSDCLGTALRQKAAGVLQIEILPRPPESRSEKTPWPLWPDICRESSSHKEGGRRLWATTALEFLGTNGHLAAMKCVEVEWMDAGDGRMRPSPKKGTEFETPAQLALLAMGFIGPAKNSIFDDLKLDRDDRGNIRTDSRHMTGVDGIFAAGDSARGQSLVVRAIADGRDAANGMLEYLAAARPAPKRVSEQRRKTGIGRTA